MDLVYVSMQIATGGLFEGLSNKTLAHSKLFVLHFRWPQGRWRITSHTLAKTNLLQTMHCNCVKKKKKYQGL